MAASADYFAELSAHYPKIYGLPPFGRFMRRTFAYPDIA
jgi:hypothetical protein